MVRGRLAVRILNMQEDDQRDGQTGLDACPSAATTDLATPYLLFDLEMLVQSARALAAAFAGVEVFYAMKCNAHPRIVGCLADLGLGFEVASPAEVESLLSLGVSPSRMMCLHPIKAPAFVAQLGRLGVQTLAADSIVEVEKVARHAPGSQILLRLDIGGSGSLVPLGGKFGCRPAEAVELSRAVRRSGLRFGGVTLHVGSQCQSLRAWQESLSECRALCERLAEEGSPCEIISLGGGFPVPYTPDVPDLASIGDLVASADLAAAGAPGCRVTMEPGRALVATAGTLVTSVVGTAVRDGVTWIYLDAGIFQGLMEFLPAAGGLRLPVTADGVDGGLARHPYRLAGPTCDSLDALPGLFDLPEVSVGDGQSFVAQGLFLEPSGRAVFSNGIVESVQ